MKTSELTRDALNWAVGVCEGEEAEINHGEIVTWKYVNGQEYRLVWQPSTDWAQGGPIIEREKIATRYDHDEQEWQATFPDMDGWVYGWGTTPLIAAMRCYVASKLGDDIELPEE